MSKQKKVGILSGTFDPFHLAHLEACLVAQAACELDSVNLMIEKNPHRKYNVSSYKDRYSMVDLATSEFPQMRVLDVADDNITIENTLPILREQFPESEYWYILGSDVVMHLKYWHKANLLFDTMKLCVILRENKERKETQEQLKFLQKEFKNLDYTILPEVWSPISSSKIRRQIKETGYSSYVHREVLKYILKNNLY